MSYRELIQRRADLTAEAQQILDRAKAAGRDLTSSESALFARLENDIHAINRKIDEEGARLDRERERRRGSGGLVVADGMGGGGSAETYGFEDLGDFLAAVGRKARGEGVDARLTPLRLGDGGAAIPFVAAMNTEIGTEGGFAVPEQFVDRALGVDLEDGAVLLNSCDRVTMSTKLAGIPAFADADRSSTAPYGIDWKMVPESGSIGDAQKVPFRKVNLEAKKAGALFGASNEWLSDASASMRGRLEGIFRMSLRWFIEGKLWNGTGAGAPLGALVSDGALSIPKEQGQPGGTIVTENIVKMWARLKPGSHGRAIWVANATCFPQLATLTIGVGTAGIVQSLLRTDGAGIAGKPSTSIFGRPLFLSEHLPAVGNAGDIVLLDPMLYLFGDRRSVGIDASPHVRFAYDETTFRVLARFDGQPALNTVLTPKNGDTVAWLVKVATRA